MPFYLRERSFQETPYLLTSGGTRFLISPSPAGELVFERGTGAAWDEPRSLAQQGEKYCAALDTEGLPNLVIMDQGSFHHVILPVEQGKGNASLFYHEESKQCSHFLMTGERRGGLHFICLAVDPSTERWWLLHHRCSGSSWEEPRVIDFGSGASENYGDLAVDAGNCLHLVYRVVGAGQAGLYYRYFDPESSHWSKAFPLSTSPAVDYPSIAVDHEQNLHVSWRTIHEGEYYICYRFMGGPGWKAGGWKPETVISPSMTKAPLPFFSSHFGELLIAWLESGTLWRYRFSGDQWERIEPQRFDNPLLIRSSSFSPEGIPLNYRILVEGSKAAAGTPLSGLLPAEEDNLQSDFTRLHRYSGKLISRISELSTTKTRLGEEVKTRNKEMLLLSQKSEKNMRLLRKSLDDKDAELKKLQEDFNQITGTMKQKIKQSSQTREAERRRYLNELQELKKERRQMEKIMQEREKTISRLEARIREQQYWIEKLSEENKTLITKAAENWSLRKLWERIGLHKKP